jgi:7-cyano-7-deazaguanine synthase
MSTLSSSGAAADSATGSAGGARRPRAVVLLSGGLDSATTLALAGDDGFETHALAVRYGQRHAVELQAAEAVARSLGAARFWTVEVDLRTFGGSALTATELEVPKGRSADSMQSGIPITYVPARNTVFLSLALAAAEVIDARAIYLGINAVDYSGYPDCRPEFLEAFSRLAALATRAGVEGRGPEVRAPLIRMSKAEIIRTGVRLGVDYGLTLSCYDPDQAGRACGACDSCQLRRRGFQDAGVPDPTRYR